MTLQRILIVDDGERELDSGLSAELAELGYASVTASLDATDAVLALIPTPTAIVVQIPRSAEAADRRRFESLADRLRARREGDGVPVILVEAGRARPAGGFGAILAARVGAAAFAKPER